MLLREKVSSPASKASDLPSNCTPTETLIKAATVPPSAINGGSTPVIALGHDAAGIMAAAIPAVDGKAHPLSRLRRRAPTVIPSYHRIGNLEVRLATRKREVKKAQRVRYKVFYKEMSAIPDMQTKMKRRDIDSYDKICDHLVVVDHSSRSSKTPFRRKSKIIGTYRILTEEKATAHGGFYTESEYNLAPLLARKGPTHKFLELGRSCVLKPYRNKRSVEMLWHGLWAYIQEQKADVMIGCASFEGTDPKAHALALSFLHHHARAPADWRVEAHSHHAVDMNMIPKEEIELKKAMKALPPLIKGYLRLGAYIGDGAVVDQQFGTTDIIIIMPVAAIDKRYFAHFSNTKPSQQLSEAEPGDVNPGAPNHNQPTALPEQGVGRNGHRVFEPSIEIH